MQRNTSGATRSSRKAGNGNRGKASRRGTEGTVRNAVRVGAGGKEMYLYRHNENKEVPENAEVPAVRCGYAVGVEKGTGRTVRRNWRQVAGLRPSVHQVGRKPYEQQYSLLPVQGVLRKEQHKVLRHSLVKALTRKPAHQCGR